jgi:hypothetical protein
MRELCARHPGAQAVRCGIAPVAELYQDNVFGVSGAAALLFFDRRPQRGRRSPGKRFSMALSAHTLVVRWSRIWDPVVVATALCALVLRLAIPAPIPVDPEIGLVALFGEHALCISDAARAGPDQVPSRQPSPAPDRHDDHHTGWCCHWHTAAAIVPPAGAAPFRIDFATPADRVAAAAIAPPARPGGPAQPRAPPKQS